jgi:hypothetical protein
MEKIIKNYSTIIAKYESEVQAASENLFDITIKTIRELELFCAQSGGLIEHKISIKVWEYWFTRLASALTQYFIDPKTQLKTNELVNLTSHRAKFSYIFASSGYRGMSHLIPLCSKGDAINSSKYTLSTSKAIMLLCIVGIEDTTEELLDLAMQLKPELLFPIYLSWLNQPINLTSQGERNRTKLLNSVAKFESISINDSHIPEMVRIWMFCSYASTPNKHSIKYALNKLFIKRMSTVGIKPKPVLLKIKKRPRLLVIHEHFKSQHAMYRCYAPLIKSLHPDFELISYSDNLEIDDKSKKIFDQIQTSDIKKMSIEEIVKKVQEFNADIILYPSLGMKIWTVLISNLRLAPIQVACQGHPATTHSTEIDYIFLPDCTSDMSLLYSEKLLIGSDEQVFEAHADLPLDLPKKTRINDGNVHIAINCKDFKLSYPLINICNRLIKEAKYPIQFHFFPGSRGLAFVGISAMLKFIFPNAHVHPYMCYPDLLQHLKNCDLSMASFPFGNANGTVDACLLGLPIVAHFGPELPAQTDKFVLNAAEYPEWLINDTDEKYFQTALVLINNPDLRQQFNDIIKTDEIHSKLIIDKERQTSQPLGRLLKYIYKNHKIIKAKNKRVIRSSEIDTLSNI